MSNKTAFYRSKISFLTSVNKRTQTHYLGNPEQGKEKDGEGWRDARVPDVEQDVGQGRVESRPHVVRVP